MKIKSIVLYQYLLFLAFFRRRELAAILSLCVPLGVGFPLDSILSCFTLCKTTPTSCIVELLFVLYK